MATKAEAARLNGKKGGRPRKSPPVDGLSAAQHPAEKVPRPKPSNAGKGRKPGVPNKVTAEAQALAAAILNNPAYVRKLTDRALAGKLPPAVETMLWYYKSGKPKEHVAVEGEGGGPILVRFVDATSAA